MTGNHASVLYAARAADAAGLCPLPTCEDGTKRPDVSTWRAYQTTRPTDAEMGAWRWDTRAGLGIVAGAVSGHRECWDFDEAATFDAFVEAAHKSGLGAVVDRVREGFEDETPSGGVRWLATYPVESTWKDVTLARRPGRDGEPAVKTLIELPTFAIVAPSAGGVHPTGRPYVRRRGDFATIASYTRDERDAMLALARSFDAMPRAHVAGDAPRGPVTGQTRPGDDFAARTTWPELLEPEGWTIDHRRGDVTSWRRPGKTIGLSATTNHEGSDLLYVFSSSTPFEPERSHSRFGAYAVLKHGGDFSRAAQALAQHGYGTRASSRDARPSVSRTPISAAKNWPAPLRPVAFTGIIGEIVSAVAPQTEADPAALLLQATAMFGSVIGRTAHFRVGADVHYLNLFVGIVGDTAKARKGVSRGQAQRIFSSADAEWADRCLTSGMSSGEGLIWAIRDAIEKQQPIKECGRVVDYQIVTEDPGISDKRLMVVEPELASTLKVMSREGNTLSAIVRQAWDGQTLQTITKSSPARATAPHISIIGHITRDELLRYLEVTEAANGFGNRFLWCAARRSRELPDGGDAVNLDPFHGRLQDVVGFARGMGEITRDEEARRLWHRVYGPLSAGRPGMFGAMTARAEAQVMRLAALYAMGVMSYVVRPEHLRAALEVWRYCHATAGYLLGDRLGDPTADGILAALRRAHPTSLTRTEITHDVFKRNKSAGELDRAFGLLEKYRLATVEMDGSGEGRPVERWVAAESSTAYDINEFDDITPAGPDPYVVSDVNVVTPAGTPGEWEDVA